MASRPCHLPLRQPQDGSASGKTHQNFGLETQKYQQKQVVLSIGKIMNAFYVFGIILVLNINLNQVDGQGSEGRGET